MNPPDAEVIGAFGYIPIKPYKKPYVPGLKNILVETISSDTSVVSEICKKTLILDSLLISGCAIGLTPRPSWSGYMQIIMQGSGSYEISKINPLPFINMDPNNLTTIYSALRFSSDHCHKHGIATCLVTFDQPLFMKASEIVAASAELSNVVVRLGGFHLLMSYMGAVGHIMSGSGLEYLWSTVCAKSSVTHMMSGHAYARALRAHYLTQEALAKIKLNDSNCLDDVDKESLREIYNELLTGLKSVDDALKSEWAQKINTLLSQCCEQAKTVSRTAKLWAQYFD